MPLIGAQISTAGGFAPVPARAHGLGAEVVQVFASNPRMWRCRLPGAEEMKLLVAGLRLHRLPLFFHSIYLINLATPDDSLRRQSVGSLAHALVLGARAGAAGVVTHIGSHRGTGAREGCRRATAAVKETFSVAAASLAAQAPHAGLPQLLFESGAGSGHSLGGHLDELASLLQDLDRHFASSALGICIDTAHLFSAGYRIHEREGLESLLASLGRLDLLSRLALVHVNDCATPLGSRHDRHENPGAGQIGYDGLARVVRHPALAHLPFVLETPGIGGHGPDAANLAVVKAMRAGKTAQAAAEIVAGLSSADRPAGRA